MHFKFLCSPNIAAKYVGQKLTKLSIKRGTATIIIEIISFSKQVICLTKVWEGEEGTVTGPEIAKGCVCYVTVLITGDGANSAVTNQILR